jgi:PII-like signaling protein/predicted transcriptional regulator
MSSTEPIQRVRIYLNERDQAAGQPLYLAVLEQLRREGATGATALRGIAGFGAGSRLRTSGIADFSPAPIVVEWIDRAERVARVLPALDQLLPDALITIEDLRAYRAVLRSGGPFGERTVGEVMAREVAAAVRDMSLRAAAELIIERGQTLLPVLDDRGGLVGVLSDGDLVRRAGLALAPRLFGALTADERKAVLDLLAPGTVAAVLTADPRSAYVESPVPLAVSPMIEWGFDLLPVLDRDGRMAGLFGIEQALRAGLRNVAAAADPPGQVSMPIDAAPLDVSPRPSVEPGQAIRAAEPPTPVGLVMQRIVPTIAADTPLAETLARLLAAPDRFLVVLEAGRPVGTLTDLYVARTLGEPLRSNWLAALRTQPVPLPTPLDGAMAELSAGGLAEPNVPAIEEQATLDAAIQRMLDGGLERLLVLDERGQVAGLLARRSLLRALAQASAA